MSHTLFHERVNKCALRMEEHGLDVLLLTKPSNMFYLTGDGRLCAYCMITRSGEVAMGVPVTDVDDVSRLAHFDHITGFDDEVGMIHSIAHFFEHFGIEKGVMGLEYTYLTQSMMAMMTHPHAKPERVSVQDCTHILSQMRMVKDPEEINLIRAAARVASMAMVSTLDSLRPGMTESQVAAEAEYAMRRAGAEDFWRTYVSSGPRTNLAHGLPTHREIRTGDLVMIDIHPIVDNYSADICRTVCVGQPEEEQHLAYDLFLKAQQSTIEMAHEGIGMVDLEGNLHAVLREGGHGDHIFGPPIHGLGIEFEEAPLPPGHAFFHGEKAPPPLSENTVLAVGNCGLYTGPWGLRVEDTIVLTRDEPILLTDAPHRLV